MTWIIDRIENDIAVIEYDVKKTAEIPLTALPKGAKEGDALKISLDEKETEKRKENIKKLSDRLFTD